MENTELLAALRAARKALQVPRGELGDRADADAAWLAQARKLMTTATRHSLEEDIELWTDFTDRCNAMAGELDYMISIFEEMESEQAAT